MKFRSLFLPIVLAVTVLLPGCSSSKSPSPDGYTHASGKLWTGVKLYFGSSRTYVFEVIGGNDNYRSPSGETMRGIKVRYPNGNEEWKDRDYIISGDNYWVREDDPALAAERWQVLEN